MKTFKEYVVYEILKNNKKYWIYRLIKLFFIGNSGQRVVFLYRLAKNLSDKNIKLIPIFLFRHLEKTYGVYISKNASIEIGLKFPHPTGIVIGDGVEIGKNCIIYQQVTFGGARLGDAKNNYYPHVGDNVVFFAGAKVIGKITIKSNSVIGANSVVIKDVPEGCTVVGVPARIIGDKKNHD